MSGPQRMLVGCIAFAVIAAAIKNSSAKEKGEPGNFIGLAIMFSMAAVFIGELLAIWVFDDPTL